MPNITTVSVPDAGVFTQKEWIIAGISFVIGAVACLVVTVVVILSRIYVRNKNLKAKAKIMTIVPRDEISSCVFVSETPILENATYGQNIFVTSNNDIITHTTNPSVSSQKPVLPDRDSDYSLATFKRQHSKTVVEATISHAFKDASPVIDQPHNSSNSPANSAPELLSFYPMGKETNNVTLVEATICDAFRVASPVKKQPFNYSNLQTDVTQDLFPGYLMDNDPNNVKIVESTISDAFRVASPVKEQTLDSCNLQANIHQEPLSSYLMSKEPNNVTENFTDPDYENPVLNTRDEVYQSLKQSTADYQVPLNRKLESSQLPDKDTEDYQFPRSNLGDFQSLTENMMDYQVHKSNTGYLQTPSQSIPDYQFPKSNVGVPQSPNLNVARVRPTFLEIKERSPQSNVQYSPNNSSKTKGLIMQSPVPVVKEEKGVQTEPIESGTQRESILSGYSKPKETGERRSKKRVSTDREYDYASFINLIKYAVKSSLTEESKFDLQRTTSAMPCKQKPKSQFDFPGHNDARPVVRSVSVKQSRRPQERLPMPLKKQHNSIEYEHDEISYFRKASSTPMIHPGNETEDSSDNVASPPYIDPNQINPRVQQQNDDSEDSDDDLMAIDDDFKDYVSTLKKQIPLPKVEQKTEKKCESDPIGSSTESLLSEQITVEIRRGGENPSSGKRRSSSYICIELNDNILTRLAHKNGREEVLPETENEDGSNDAYMVMGQVPIYGNIDEEEDYLPMDKIDYTDDPDVYLCMDGVNKENDADDNIEEPNPGHFYLKITG